jgi:hypothetical protein
VLLAVKALAHQLAGPEQHQAVDQLGLALGSSAEVAADQGVCTGIVKVPGDIGRAAGGHGDQRIERGAPGVQWMRDQVDFFYWALRVVEHGRSLAVCR